MSGKYWPLLEALILFRDVKADKVDILIHKYCLLSLPLNFY